MAGGEDAFFTLPKDLGIFDGVGGWTQVRDPLLLLPPTELL